MSCLLIGILNIFIFIQFISFPVPSLYETVDTSWSFSFVTNLPVALIDIRYGWVRFVLLQLFVRNRLRIHLILDKASLCISD